MFSIVLNERMGIKILSQAYLSQHRYFTARKDSYRLPSGKVVDPYFVVELPPSVVVMALTADEQVLLVKQYRHPVQEILTELPGGFIDPNEAPEKAVARELLEETGYVFSSIQFLGETMANPGVLSSVCKMYLAKGGVQKSAQQLDPNEEIEIELKSLDDVEKMLAQGLIKQSMHALCLFYGFIALKRPVLTLK